MPASTACFGVVSYSNYEIIMDPARIKASALIDDTAMYAVGDFGFIVITLLADTIAILLIPCPSTSSSHDWSIDFR